MANNYSKEDLEKLIRETTRHGAIHATLYFDAHGKSEDLVRNSLVDFIDRLSKEKGVLYCVGEILPAYSREEPPQTVGGEPRTTYSTSSEINLLADSFITLIHICFRYGPVGVEIMAPGEVRLNLEDAQASLLEASNASQQFSEYVFRKVLKPEDMKNLDEELERRAELGRKIAEKGKDAKA